MVLADLAARAPTFRFAILGTDISTAVLAQASRAVYPSEWSRRCRRTCSVRYVMRSRRTPARGRRCASCPSCAACARFARLNLMDARYPFDRDVDVIFLPQRADLFRQADSGSGDHAGWSAICGRAVISCSAIRSP